MRGKAEKMGLFLRSLRDCSRKLRHYLKALTPKVRLYMFTKGRLYRPFFAFYTAEQQGTAEEDVVEFFVHNFGVLMKINKIY